MFSFNNRNLILALRDRGSKIAYQDWDGLKKADERVCELFQDFNSLTIPTSCFVTFESDDYKEYALMYNGDKTVLGKPMKFHDASEPTDIIWENRHFTKTDYIKRQLCAFSIIALILGVSFIIIFVISAYSAKMASIFPVVNCSGVQASYGDLFQQYAVNDYDYIIANNGEGVQSSGTLPCFCK